MPTTDLTMGGFTCNLAFGKPRSGQLPLFTSIKQVQPFSSSDQMDSSKITFTDQASSIREIISSVTISWGLNTNPLFRMVICPPADAFVLFADFPGFSKNSTIGIQFIKEQLSGQATPWVYGITQYPLPSFDPNLRTIQVDGYGILLEASRRQNSRNFKTAEVKAMVSTIAKRYGMDFATRGPVPDVILEEPEQNVDDMTFLNIISAKLDSYWVIEENTLVLIGANYMFNQTPKINFIFGKLNVLDSNNSFPISEFIPSVTARSFEPGAARLTARGIDLDSGKIAQKILSPQRTRLGVLSLSSSQFRSDSGVTINTDVLRPCPDFESSLESEVFLPLHTRSDEELIYQFQVEKKDLSIHASLETLGMPGLKPGMIINVQGVGELFSGNYIIEGIEHTLAKEKGFTTVLRLMRNGLGQIQSATPFKTNLDLAPASASSGGVLMLAETLPL